MMGKMRELENRNILVISPAFAPCTLVGAARMTSLAGFLQERGYLVTVISVGRWYYSNDLWIRKVPVGVFVIEIEKTTHYEHVLKLKISEILAQGKYDICIASMGPFETQKFLWRLCKKQDVPLVLDYRDPWLFYPFYYSGRSIIVKAKRLLKDLYFWRYEYASIKYASQVVTVTEKNTAILKRRYKKYASKMVTVFNGFEDMDSIMAEQPNKHKGYMIACAGKFLYYNKTAAIRVIKTVNELNRKGYEIKIFHIGEESDNASDILKKMNLDDSCYQYAGKMRYDDAMKFIWDMDAVLVVYGSKEGLGTKVFDYVGLSKPIIYSGVLPSELGDFVSKFKNVVIADNERDLKIGIAKLARERIQKLGDNNLRDYSREKQNEKYMKLIKKVMTAE